MTTYKTATSGKRTAKLFNWLKDKTITGKAIRVLKYGYNVNPETKKIEVTFVTVETSGGIEDIYTNGYQCLADAMDCNVIVKVPA